jgi:twitching motility protein PilT
MAVDIAQLLTFAVKNNASDLHLSAGVPPMIRVDGDMKRINMPALTHKEVHSMVYDIMNDKQRKAYEEFYETDFSFEIPEARAVSASTPSTRTAARRRCSATYPRSCCRSTT